MKMDLSEDYQPLNLEIIKPVATKSYSEAAEFYSDEPRTILNLEAGNQSYSSYYMGQSVIAPSPLRSSSPPKYYQEEWIKFNYQSHAQYLHYNSSPGVSSYYSSLEPRERELEAYEGLSAVEATPEGTDWRGNAVQIESGN